MSDVDAELDELEGSRADLERQKDDLLRRQTRLKCCPLSWTRCLLLESSVSTYRILVGKAMPAEAADIFTPYGERRTTHYAQTTQGTAWLCGMGAL